MNLQNENLHDFKALYFVSDAHLGAPYGVSEEVKRRRLFAFGGGIASPDTHLFIIGDLFDFWYEWRRAIPKRHFRVLREIASWVDRGLKVHYLPGNHDFRLGGFLEREVGMQTYKEKLDFTAAGKRFHLFHGDGLRKSDIAYRCLKKVFRNPINQWLFLLIHPDLGLKIADTSSKTSRISQSKERELVKDYAAYAEEKISEGIDYVIMGHTHLPTFMEIGKGIYMNTGDWYRRFTYGVFKEDKLSLEHFIEGGYENNLD